MIYVFNITYNVAKMPVVTILMAIFGHPETVTTELFQFISKI